MEVKKILYYNITISGEVPEITECVGDFKPVKFFPLSTFYLLEKKEASKDGIETNRGLYVWRKTMRRVGSLSLDEVSLIFCDEMRAFSIVVNGETLPVEELKRFYFLAETDAMSIFVYFCPGAATDARPSLGIVTKDHEGRLILHQMLGDRIYEATQR